MYAFVCIVADIQNGEVLSNWLTKFINIAEKLVFKQETMNIFELQSKENIFRVYSFVILLH